MSTNDLEPVSATKKNDEHTDDKDLLSAVVGALLDELTEKNDDATKSAVHDAIKRISHRNSETVIFAAIYYFELHRKISTVHASAVFAIMIETLRDYQTSAELTSNLAEAVAELAISKLSIPDHEKEASELLVALSRLHCNETMGCLLNKLEPSLIPSCGILRAMGFVASCNPFGMVPFIKLAMSFIYPLLSQQSTFDDEQRHTFCYIFGKFAEAINDYIANIDEAPDSRIGKEIFYDEMLTAFECFTNNWLKISKNLKLIESILTALCPILSLLPDNEQKISARMEKLISTLLNFCAMPVTRLSATRFIAMILVNCTKYDELREEKETLRQFIDPIQHLLFDFVNVTHNFEVACFRDTLLTHYEVLQCYRALVILFPEEGLDRVLQFLRWPVNSSQRTRALVIIRHLINTLPAEDYISLQRIALSIQNILDDSKVKQMVGPITALVAHPTLSLLPSQRTALIRFIVLRCGIVNDETQSYEEALFLLATTVDGAENWLWTALLKILLDVTYTSSSEPVLRALTALAIKIQANQNENAENNSDNYFKEFSGTKILARCLQLLGVKKCNKNQLAVINFLRSSAALFGHQLKPEWNEKLPLISQIVEYNMCYEWEIVDIIEKSVQLEGSDWAGKLAKELAGEILSPGVPIYLGAVTDSEEHIHLLISSSRHQPYNTEYPRAVGILSKRHPQSVINLMENAREAEDSRKNPTRLLGLVKDSKAAASVEASKANLLRCYGEIFEKSNDISSPIYFPLIEKNILPWIIKQLTECKDIGCKEAGLFALEHLAGMNIFNPKNETTEISAIELKGKASCLATLLTLLQSHSGYKPIQLYPQLLKSIISLLKIPPELNYEEQQVLLRTILDKVIVASSDIDIILSSENKLTVIDELGKICSEIMRVNSSNILAEIVDILAPWMHSKTHIERQVALLILCETLKSYCNTLKYTFPVGKFEPSKLIGRIICWSADELRFLRRIAVDAIGVALEIVAKHRQSSTTPNSTNKSINSDLNKAKEILKENDHIHNGIGILSRAVCQRVTTNDEILSLAEGLIEGLVMYREENCGLAAGIALNQLFKIRGAEIHHSDLYLVDNVVEQMRLLKENSGSTEQISLVAASAVKSLMFYHPAEVMEHLLHQPLLPIDPEARECWIQIGSDEESGLIAIDFIINRLDNTHLFSQTKSSPTSSTLSSLSSSNRGTSDIKNTTVSSASLSGIIALRYLCQASRAKLFIKKRLTELMTVLIKYLSAWLHADAPVSVVSTKFGFIPNRKGSKLNPYGEVYTVLKNLLTLIDTSVESTIDTKNYSAIESDFHINETNLMSIIRSAVRCVMKLREDELLINIGQSLGKLVTSPIHTQRAAVIAVYAELIGSKIDLGSVWLDAIINTLMDAKTDSSYLVRKFAIIGLSQINCLEGKQRDEYLDSSIMALLDGLDEEPSSNNEGSQIILESLRGLEALLPLKTKHPVSPRVILSLKPFCEKDNWEMRLASISALRALSRGWLMSINDSHDDDVTEHLLGCIPCLAIKLEDSHEAVAKAARGCIYDIANLLQCEPLALTIKNHLNPSVSELNVESFYKDLVNCLSHELPSKAEEFRNATVRGYSKSEVNSIRSTSVLILGFFGQPRPEDLQRMLQLLRDKESIVKLRAAKALAHGFTI